MIERISYRAHQFWSALNPNPAPEDLELVRNLLTPAQMDLFTCMHASEQLHSIAVLKQVRSAADIHSCDQSQNLFVAALLHDVGKSRYPLRLWERVIIVLAKALIPGKVSEWSSGNPYGWRRVFVIAEHHPEWGGQMAAEVDTAPLVVELIRQHQNFYHDDAGSIEGRLLKKLQVADQNN
jgi:putative nucleotidyltransferase with HDIG domain